MATKIEEIGEEIAIVRPTGRIANVPNSMVLQVPVHNYGSERSHIIWDSISFTLTYESDLRVAREVMLRVAEECVKREFEEEIEEKPGVRFTPSQSWIEAAVRYPVKIGSGTR
jgi:small-conductance mechanosensitive channel